MIDFFVCHFFGRGWKILHHDITIFIFYEPDFSHFHSKKMKMENVCCLCQTWNKQNWWLQSNSFFCCHSYLSRDFDHQKKIHFIRLSKTDSLIIFIDFILLYLIECFILWYLRIILNLLFVIKYDRCLVFMILSFIINFYNFCNDNNMVLPDYSYTFWF